MFFRKQIEASLEVSWLKHTSSIFKTSRSCLMLVLQSMKNSYTDWRSPEKITSRVAFTTKGFSVFIRMRVEPHRKVLRLRRDRRCILTMMRFKPPSLKILPSFRRKFGNKTQGATRVFKFMYIRAVIVSSFVIVKGGWSIILKCNSEVLPQAFWADFPPGR